MPDQFTSLHTAILPDVLHKNRMHKRVAIWTAGCSTGEEAYSLAMLLQHIAKRHEWHASIVATDINTSSLEQARRGSYRLSSYKYPRKTLRYSQFRNVFERLTSSSNSTRAVDEKLRDTVTFQKHNLITDPPGTFDIIFCRQVLIYFTAEWRERVLKRLHDALVPGGYLFLGFTEQNTHAAFHRLDGHPFIYQRK